MELRAIPTRKHERSPGKQLDAVTLQRRNKLRIPFPPNVESKLKINGGREREEKEDAK